MATHSQVQLGNEKQEFLSCTAGLSFHEQAGDDAGGGGLQVFGHVLARAEISKRKLRLEGGAEHGAVLAGLVELGEEEGGGPEATEVVDGVAEAGRARAGIVGR